MKRKGQAAMEFLMTYGWAILVVLAAIAALAYFGVLSPGSMLPERTIFSGQVPNVDNAVVRVTGSTIEVPFRNSVGHRIQITNATDTFSGGDGCTVNNITVKDTDGTIIDFDKEIGGLNFTKDISNGDIFIVEFDCAQTFQQGEMISTTLTFEYRNDATGLRRPVTGTVEGRAS